MIPIWKSQFEKIADHKDVEPALLDMWGLIGDLQEKLNQIQDTANRVQTFAEKGGNTYDLQRPMDIYLKTLMGAYRSFASTAERFNQKMDSALKKRS